MGIEQLITEELAGISMTLTEVSAMSKLINGEIRNETFIHPFNRMISEINKCYYVVTENLQPFARLNNLDVFSERYDELAQQYRDCYLKEISRPRTYSDEAYEQYLALQGMKECKTSYPLLKRTFSRLDEFIDKWVTNDAWLAMGIDNLFKRMPRLLNDVSELKRKEVEDAFVIFHSAFETFKVYLDLIEQQSRELEHPDGRLAVAI